MASWPEASPKGLWNWLSSPAKGSTSPKANSSSSNSPDPVRPGNAVNTEPSTPPAASSSAAAGLSPGGGGGSSSDEVSPSSRNASNPSFSTWASSSADAGEPKLLDEKGRVMASQTLSPFVLRQLAAALPSRFCYADWRILYSTAVHGISLNTFYQKTHGCGCCLLALRDASGNVFGGFCTEWREPSGEAKFYGGGETFLYSVEKLRNLPPLPVGDEKPPDEAVHVHRWSGANSFFMLSGREHLAMGSGGHFGLCLDSELLHGSSGPCETFGNECLCRQRCDGPFDDEPPVGEFRCDVLEVWGMDHAKIKLREQELMMRGVARTVALGQMRNR